MAPLPPAVVLSPPAAPVGPQEMKHKVVDLTEETKPEDDLQRAIALSLQDGGKTSASAATSSQTVSGVSQEEQDVSKALEASLLETTRGRKKKEEQNPHDRERNGEVGQDMNVSCSTNPPTTLSGRLVLRTSARPVGSLPSSKVFSTSPFSVPWSSTSAPRKSSRARRRSGRTWSSWRSCGSSLPCFSARAGNTSTPVKRLAFSEAVWVVKTLLPMITTNRSETSVDRLITSTFQDVCEFTHKLLDWLEEAFKIRDVSQKSDVPMKEDLANTDNAKVGEEPMEAENLEKADAEKDSPVNLGISEGQRTGAVEKNPMYSLFYGQVGPYLLTFKINCTILRRTSCTLEMSA